MKTHILMFNIVCKFYKIGDLGKITGDFRVIKE